MKAYLILLIFLINVINSSFIKIPFKNQRSIDFLSNDNSDMINDYLLEGDIALDIKIGSEKQIIPMSLDLDKKYIYITSNSLNIGIYDKDKSSSFNTNNEAPFSDFSYFKKGLYCNETFLFDNDIKGDNISFILTTEMSDQNEYRKGLIGLQIVSYKKEETLINQLKKKKLIDKYYHFMMFIKEDEGYFIIGEQPHEYDSLKYSSSDLRQVNTREISSSWELYIKNIKYGENEFEPKSFSLNFNFGFISVGVNIKNEFYNDFFKKRIDEGLCEQNFYKDYFIYSCVDDDKKVKFNELKTFHFYSYELEYDFIFDYNDLFISHNNKKYFLITYKLNSLVAIFGKPFFKKYTIVLNPDNKQIGHYIKINSKEEKNENNNIKIYIFIFIIFSLIAIIIFLGYIISKFLKRKKRKNELDENFDYISEEIENKEIN